MPITRISRLALAVVLLVWPVLLDAEAMARTLCPNLCISQNVPLPFILKVTSLAAGATIVSAEVVPAKMTRWLLWTLRGLVLVVVMTIFFVAFEYADFVRGFRF